MRTGVGCLVLLVLVAAFIGVVWFNNAKRTSEDQAQADRLIERARLRPVEDVYCTELVLGDSARLTGHRVRTRIWTQPDVGRDGSPYVRDPGDDGFWGCGQHIERPAGPWRRAAGGNLFVAAGQRLDIEAVVLGRGSGGGVVLGEVTQATQTPARLLETPIR